jgi:AsmA family protein
VRASGADLGSIALLARVPQLPHGVFDVAGRIRIERGLLRLSDATASIAKLRGSASGTVGLGKSTGGFDLDVAVRGPDIAQLADLELLQRLAGEPISVDGHVRRDGTTVRFSRVQAAVGNLSIDADGSVEGAGDVGQVSLQVSAPDTKVPNRVLGETGLPDGPVTASVKMSLSKKQLTLRDAKLNIGEYTFAADGILSTDPMSNKSDLRFSAVVPELRRFGRIMSIESLPAKPFRIEGAVNGIPTGFAVENIVARLGGNDIRGRFAVDLRARPAVSGWISSSYLDLRDQLSGDDSGHPAAAQDDHEFLFSDEPLPLDWLQLANLDLSLKTDRVLLPQADMLDLNIGVRLQDGTLSVAPIAFHGPQRGTVSASLGLAPVDGGHRLDVRAELDKIHLGLLAGTDQDRSTLPPTGGQVELSGAGESLHQIMASSNGKIAIRQGKGKTRDLSGMRIFGDVIFEIFRTLNPMHTPQPYATVECAFYEASIKDGMATLDNVAVQTEKLTMIASGTINLKNEGLKLTVRAKNREGLGISIGGVANSFLMLGGTLRHPGLQVDPKASVTTTGAAVATGGLSILAKGLWDRISAEADICEENNK